MLRLGLFSFSNTPPEEAVTFFIRFFRNADRLTFASLAVGLFVAFLYFKVIFQSALDPDPPVDPKRDYVEAQWKRVKVLLWMFISVGSGILAYHQLPHWFPQWFK